MSQTPVLYIDNTNSIWVKGLQNSVTGEYVNNATVTVSLSDKSGALVSGSSWPLTLAYVTGSDGFYQASLPASLNLVNTRYYVASVTADVAGEYQAAWDQTVVARQRYQ